MSSETLNVQETGEVDFVVVVAASAAWGVAAAVVATVAAVVVACAHMHHILPRVRERVCDYVSVCD